VKILLRQLADQDDRWNIQKRILKIDFLFLFISVQNEELTKTTAGFTIKKINTAFSPLCKGRNKEG